MSNFSFVNTPQGGIAVTKNQQEYLESSDQIAGLEIEGTIADQDVIRYDGASGTFELVNLDLKTKDSGSQVESDTKQLDFGYLLEVTDNGNGELVIDTASQVIEEGENVSLLNNDANYIAELDNISLLTNDANYVAEGDNVSVFTNDAGYVTDASTTYSRKTVTTSSLTDGSTYYSVDSSGGAITLTLASADAVDGVYIAVKRNGANAVDVDTEGAETIDGTTPYSIGADDGSAEFVFNADNSDWEVF